MPTIDNVRLTIGRAEDSAFRRVTVRYRVCFTTCEARAESTFVERVVLRGDDLIDEDLITLRSICMRAREGCVDRSVSATVSTATLDEDGDTIFLGIVLNADRDEIYARVTLKPFTPSGATGDSDPVKGQFGPGA